MVGWKGAMINYNMCRCLGNISPKLQKRYPVLLLVGSMASLSENMSGAVPNQNEKNGLSLLHIAGMTSRPCSCFFSAATALRRRWGGREWTQVPQNCEKDHQKYCFLSNLGFDLDFGFLQCHKAAKKTPKNLVFLSNLSFDMDACSATKLRKRP